MKVSADTAFSSRYPGRTMLIIGSPHSASPFHGCSADASSIRCVARSSPTLSSVLIRTASGAHSAWNTPAATTANSTRKSTLRTPPAFPVHPACG